MHNIYLIITSIADANHPGLKQFAKEAFAKKIPFVVIGDTKSPENFDLNGCEFYSIERQKSLKFLLAKELPFKHYSRKNLGYLVAISKGADVIIETDDDNYPLPDFWSERNRWTDARVSINNGWTNVYKYFNDNLIWPRGFDLSHIKDNVPELDFQENVYCPIQQGLADDNPDVDAIYRLIQPLPIKFRKAEKVALGDSSFCPFNSQNTTWFREAFPLLYLPSYCNFRMTDIWRSFIAQRIAWTCDWNILFHECTLIQERNSHNLLNDFKDEVPGYLNNAIIYNELTKLDLRSGVGNIMENLIKCYQLLIDLKLVSDEEMKLLRLWISDVLTYLPEEISMGN